MASTWGATALKILVDSLKPGKRPGPLTEIALLPDPADLDAISTVIQQQGKSRKEVSCKLYLSSSSEYDAYDADMSGGVERTLTIDNTGISGTYLIKELSPEFIQSDCIFLDITWLEV